MSKSFAKVFFLFSVAVLLSFLVSLGSQPVLADNPSLRIFINSFCAVGLGMVAAIAAALWIERI